MKNARLTFICPDAVTILTCALKRTDLMIAFLFERLYLGCLHLGLKNFILYFMSYYTS